MKSIILNSTILLCCTVCLSTAAIAAATNNKLNRIINRGASLETKSEYSEAIKVFSAGVEKFPTEARAYYRRGLGYLHNAQYSEAIKDLSHAIELNNQYQDAYLIRGTAFADSKDYAAAINDFDWVIQHDPTFKEVVEKKAEAYKEQEKRFEAKQLTDSISKYTARPWIAEGEPAEAKMTTMSYMKTLQKRIKANWNPAKFETPSKVVTKFKIARDGTISDIGFVKKSGDQIQDNAAMKAIKSTKAERLPIGAPGKVDIQFTFDVNRRRFTNVQHPGEEITKLIDSTSALIKNKQFDDVEKIFKKSIDHHSLLQQEEMLTDIAYYFYNLSNSEKDLEKRLPLLYQAVFYQPENTTYTEELAKTQKALGQDPNSATDRISNADKAKANHNLISSIVDYRSALKLKTDPAVQDKLNAALRALDGK